MEEKLNLIIDKLSNLEVGQKNLENRIGNLEEGQKRLELRQEKLEEGQKNSLIGQRNIEKILYRIEESQQQDVMGMLKLISKKLDYVQEEKDKNNYFAK